MTTRKPQQPQHVQGQKHRSEDQHRQQQQAENPDSREQQGGFDPREERNEDSPGRLRHQPDQAR